MSTALQAFVADPSRKNYLQARQELLAASSRILDAAQLDSLTLLYEARDARGLSAVLDALPPIAALVPRVHYYAALAAQARCDDDDFELEQMLHVICLRALLMTGDGSQETPYVVSAISDENDLLASLELVPETRKLIHRGDGAFDVVDCEDGSEIWFDVAALVRIPAEVVIPAAGKAKRGGARRSSGRAKGRLTETRH